MLWEATIYLMQLINLIVCYRRGALLYNDRLPIITALIGLDM